MICSGHIPRGLRVKRFHRIPEVWKLIWAENGRALFTSGPSSWPGEPPIIWLRIGGHEIFDE